MVFVGFIGAILAGIIGLITRHTDQDVGVKWRKVFRELPIAIFSGMIAHGIGAYMEAPLQIVIPLASAIAYIGPAIVLGLLQTFFKARFGVNDDRENRN